MERKLAHIEEIEWIRPIEGANNIELCGVLGWQCVIAKKDGFKVGDRIVYIEIDSILPEKPEYEFLKDRKYRVRTIKLRGEVSQGLVLPLQVLGSTKKTYKIGDDVTKELGIVKYLTPSEREEISEQERRILIKKSRFKKFMMRYSWFRRLFLSRKQKEGFPYWISKTDEERIQSMPQVLQQFASRYVYVTEKIDGQSVTFTGKRIPIFPWLGFLSPKKYKFIVCSRNLIVNDKDSLYWRIAKKYNIENILRENPTLTIQGEQGDTRVQGNKYSLKEPRLWVFNIIDHEKGKFYDDAEMLYFCTRYHLEVVPFLKKVQLDKVGSTVEEVVKESKGSSTLAKIPREGIVVRCVEGGKKILSFKCINPDFLLKYE